MHPLIHRHLLLPAFETLIKRRRTFAYWNELEQTQSLQREQIESMQLESLRRLVRHAFDHCAYYSKTWHARGLYPDSIGTIDDFQRWPVIDRSTVAEHRIEMRAAISRMRLISKSTGGSSGQPLRFDLDHDSNDRRTAAAHRGYAWAGVEPGTNQMYLWGVPLTAQSKRHRAKDRLYNWLHNRTMLNSFELSDQTADQFERAFRRQRPQAIIAYTNPLYTWAKMLDEKGIALPGARSIVVGAEKLFPFQRELIERVFAAPVFETYGSREFMLIGAECERREGLHLTAENLLVEILDDDASPTRDGCEGNVVITDLFNYGMPFVRYANGDRAIAGLTMCSCGRGLPLLRQVVGRRLDMIHTPQGRHVPGEFFPHLAKDFPAIKRFQVVQDAIDRVQLLIVAPMLSPTDRLRLEDIARRTLGAGVRFDVITVDDIPLSPTGKLRVVVSHLPMRKVG